MEALPPPRHWLTLLQVGWDDEFCDTYGESLLNFGDENSFIAKSPTEHTFVNRHLNGGSVFDLCFCDFTLCIDLSDLIVEKVTEIFTGAPSVGHWPVCF